MDHFSANEGSPTAARPGVSRPYYPALDGIRAIAALTVFCAHYAGFAWGWAGVNIFFVLSGFLITGILYDARHEPHRFRNFYVRRSLRIFPLYYGIFLLLLLSTPLLHWEWNKAWILWACYLGNFTMFHYFPVISNNGGMGALAGTLRPLSAIPTHFHIVLGHFWSLCVEEQFYLLWPAVVLTVKKRSTLMRICGAVVVALPFVRWALNFIHRNPPLPSTFLYGITFFQIDALLLGGFIALCLRGQRIEALKRAAHVYISGIVVIAVLAMIYQFVFRHVSAPWNIEPTWVFTFGLTMVNLFAGSIILLCLNPCFALNRLLLLRPLRALGRVSYGFYVFHAIPIVLYGSLISAHIHHFQRTITAGFALCVTIGLAQLSYRFFESPFLRMKDRWTL
jgi:peptidoglycan/LPS O-acetylase OafA/YrhL